MRVYRISVFNEKGESVRRKHHTKFVRMILDIIEYFIGGYSDGEVLKISRCEMDESEFLAKSVSEDGLSGLYRAKNSGEGSILSNFLSAHKDLETLKRELEE